VTPIEASVIIDAGKFSQELFIRKYVLLRGSSEYDQTPFSSNKGKYFMKVLVTGGAGYIGSHTMRELTHRGYDVAILDTLERGYKQAVLGFMIRPQLS
jgi:FlaA1/EpsC-like NDP-sugar epimerase